MRDGDRGKLQFFEINCKHSCFYDEVEMEAVALDEFELNAGGKRDFPDKQPERSQGRRQVLHNTVKTLSQGFYRFSVYGKSHTVHQGQSIIFTDTAYQRF